jgi:hypothetical protein
MSNSKFDLFIFGSTSELVQALIQDYKPWFLEHVERLIITQRSETYPALYQEFNPVSIQLDCANPQEFGKNLKAMVETYASSERPMHILPTYGVFNWNYAPKNPVFAYLEDGYQVNLNARLQIIDAFRGYPNARFHLFGSLFTIDMEYRPPVYQGICFSTHLWLFLFLKTTPVCRLLSNTTRLFLAA